MRFRNFASTSVQYGFVTSASIYVCVACVSMYLLSHCNLATTVHVHCSMMSWASFALNYQYLAVKNLQALCIIVIVRRGSYLDFHHQLIFRGFIAHTFCISITYRAAWFSEQNAKCTSCKVLVCAFPFVEVRVARKCSTPVELKFKQTKLKCSKFSVQYFKCLLNFQKMRPACERNIAYKGSR